MVELSRQLVISFGKLTTCMGRSWMSLIQLVWSACPLSTFSLTSGYGKVDRHTQFQNALYLSSQWLMHHSHFLLYYNNNHHLRVKWLPLFIVLSFALLHLPSWISNGLLSTYVRERPTISQIFPWRNFSCLVNLYQELMLSPTKVTVRPRFPQIINNPLRIPAQ